MRLFAMTFAAAGLTALCASPALAQTADLLPDPDETPAHVRTTMGMSVVAGGGVIAFADEDTDDFTDPGGAWEARLTIGTRTPLAFEAAYIGSVQNVEALGLDDDALLVSNGAEALARVNILRQKIQPYFVAGLGWRHYSLVNEDFNTSNIQNDDDVGEVPFGVGLAYRTAGLVLDLRGTYRAAFADDLDEEDTTDTSDPRFDTWSVAGQVGWEF